MVYMFLEKGRKNMNKQPSRNPRSRCWRKPMVTNHQVNHCYNKLVNHQPQKNPFSNITHYFNGIPSMLAYWCSYRHVCGHRNSIQPTKFTMHKSYSWIWRTAEWCWDCQILVKHHRSQVKRLNQCLKRTVLRGFALTTKTEPYTPCLLLTDT